MSSTITILESGSSEALARWSELRRDTACSHAFSSLSLVSKLAHVQNLDTRAIFVSDSGEDSVAFLATYRRVGPFFEVVPPRLVPFSPIMIRSDPASASRLPDGITALRRHLVEKYHRIVITLPPGFEATAEQIGAGWKQDTMKTYVAKLQEYAEEIPREFSGNTRRLYQKNKDLFDVREDESAAGSIIGLWLQAYERSGKPVDVDAVRLVGIVTCPEPPTQARVFVAHRRDTSAFEGGLIVLVDGSSAYYWIAGSVPGAAMTVVTGQMLFRLRSEGISTVDFVGANTPSIAAFKRRFGPTLVEYPRLVASRSRIFEAVLSARHSLSKRTTSV